jgi:hypothetical protein
MSRYIKGLKVNSTPGALDFPKEWETNVIGVG